MGGGTAYAQAPFDVPGIRVVPDQYIVVLQEGASVPGFAVGHGLAPFLRYSIINGFAAHIPADKLDRVIGDGRVASIEPDLVVRAFPKPDKPPGQDKKGGGDDPPPPPPQETPTGYDRSDADLNSNTGAGVKVAVIDTGIDDKPPDLNVVGGRNFTSRKAGQFQDGNGHGTHVAGTIAALDNAIGVIGMAPEADLYAVKVLNNNGSGFLSWVIAGIEWASDNNIDVANMSLGAPGESSAMCNAIASAVASGVTVVVAAGNESQDAVNSTPANCDESLGVETVITVSAIADSDGAPGHLGPATGYGADDTFASFSNFGSLVDIAAPGVDILSTWKGGGYNTISGTSMATPHVTGAAALYKATVPGATPADIAAALKAAGWGVGEFEYFTGDTDGINEPLLNASGL